MQVMISARVTPETKKQIKITAAMNDSSLHDFFEKTSKYILSLPSEEISKILK